jgi:hypothetical protein
VKLKISNQGKLDALRQFEGAEVDLVQRFNALCQFCEAIKHSKGMQVGRMST